MKRTSTIKQHITILLAAIMLMINSVAYAGNTLNVFYSSGSNSFSVKVSTTDDSVDKIVVMSLIGRKIKEQLFVKGQEIYTFSDMSDMPNGIYIVLIKDRNDKILGSAKLVINK
ncbi:MAG: hypothetical protein RL660_2168 [Bacteroidota bacterium]